MGSPSQLIITVEAKDLGNDKIIKTYKIVNDNLDTILILEKL